MDLENTENIIRIQRNIRGFLARKRLIGSSEGYYRVVLRRIQRKLNKFEHFYDFFGALEGDRDGVEGQVLKVAEDNEEFLNIKGGLEEDIGGEAVETLVFEPGKKIVVDLEEAFEDYMPASVSYIIIVEDFIERVEVPMRFKAICDCFDMKFEVVQRFEVNLAKPCCDIAVLERVLNNEKLVKGLREESEKKEGVVNGTEGSLVGVVKGSESLERVGEESSGLSLSSSVSGKSPLKKKDKEKDLDGNGYGKVELVVQTNESKQGLKEPSPKVKLLNENAEKGVIKDEEVRSLEENVNKEANCLEDRPETIRKQNYGNDPILFKQSFGVLKLKSESPKEKLLKGKSSNNLKDLIKKSAPIHANLNKLPSNTNKPSVFPESNGSRHSPTSQNSQLTSNPPEPKQKSSRNLKVEVQILPFEYNFLNHLGHKREDSKKLEILKNDFKHKIQKKAKDKFYPYEKWTQVLPKIKKPRIAYSSYKDYGFLSDHRCKKEIGSGKSGDHRMVSSGSEPNIVKFRRNLPKFSSYKIKLTGNPIEKFETKEETEKTSALKLKKGRINDLYNK